MRPRANHRQRARKRRCQVLEVPRLWDGVSFAPVSQKRLVSQVNFRLRQLAATISKGETDVGRQLSEKEQRRVATAVQKCKHNLESTGKARAVLALVAGDMTLCYDDVDLRVPDTLWPLPDGKTLDLSTLSTQETDPKTAFHVAGVVPQQGPCPVWDSFLASISVQNEWLGDGIDEQMGFAMQGNRDRQTLNIWDGLGRNGKGLIMRVAKAIFGRFYVPCARGCFFDDGQRNDRHEQHLLAHRGARLLDVADSYGRFQATFSLSYTGGDGLFAEQKGGASLSFVPTAMPVLHGQSERLRLHERDNALLGRLRRLEFTESFAGREDTTLWDRLRPELPAIAYRWAMIAHDFIATGVLSTENEQRHAAGMLIDELDQVGQWLNECFTPDPTHTARHQPTTLLSDFKEWATKQGHTHAERMTATAFGAQLKQNRAGWNVEMIRPGGARTYVGLARKS